MVKTITIREEVYLKLLSLKKKNESFSELFDRMVQKERPIDVLRELKGSMHFKDKKKLMAELRAMRKEWR